MKVRIQEDLTEFEGTWLVKMNTQSSMVKQYRLTLSKDGKYFATYPMSQLDVQLSSGEWMPLAQAFQEHKVSFYLMEIKRDAVNPEVNGHV